jgi:hypothetical protein
MPARRYQTPSRVRQTSSASILPPVVKRIMGLPPSLVPMPGPLVDTGAAVVRECEVAVRSSDGVFEAAVGDGAGVALSSGGAEACTTSGATTAGECATGGMSATSSPRELK